MRDGADGDWLAVTATAFYASVDIKIERLFCDGDCGLRISVASKSHMAGLGVVHAGS